MISKNTDLNSSDFYDVEQKVISKLKLKKNEN